MSDLPGSPHVHLLPDRSRTLPQILAHIAETTSPPLIHPARGPLQTELDFLRSDLNQVQTLPLSPEYICVLEQKGRPSLLVGTDRRPDLSLHLQPKIPTQSGRIE